MTAKFKPKKHAFQRLAELGVEMVAQVEARLLAGEMPSVLARWLHEDIQVFPDIKRDSLKKNLERYRKHDLKDRVVDELADKIIAKTAAGLRKKILALDELEELVAIQKGRHNKCLVKEAGMHGLLLKQASDEGRLLKEMLVELGKLQLETGIIVRAPKKVAGAVTGADGEIRRFAWTEEQERLFKTLDTLTIAEGVTDAVLVEPTALVTDDPTAAETAAETAVDPSEPAAPRMTEEAREPARESV